MKFNPLTLFPIFIVVLTEIGYSFVENTGQKLEQLGYLFVICDNCIKPGKTLQIKVAFKSRKIASI